jgi:hypothetical protein
MHKMVICQYLEYLSNEGVGCGRARRLGGPACSALRSRRDGRSRLELRSSTGDSILGYFSLQSPLEPLLFDLEIITRLKIQPETIGSAKKPGEP